MGAVDEDQALLPPGITDDEIDVLMFAKDQYGILLMMKGTLGTEAV
jgi:hypothetical protein